MAPCTPIAASERLAGEKKKRNHGTYSSFFGSSMLRSCGCILNHGANKLISSPRAFGSSLLLYSIMLLHFVLCLKLVAVLRFCSNRGTITLLSWPGACWEVAYLLYIVAVVHLFLRHKHVRRLNVYSKSWHDCSCSFEHVGRLRFFSRTWHCNTSLLALTILASFFLI